MSVHMEQAADAIIQAANEIASLSELAGGDPDPETSSSLSEMEYKDSHMEDEGELSDVANSQSEEDNDSEAETERLEESPNKIRAHKDIVLNQSNLHHQLIVDNDQDEEDDDLLSDESLSTSGSPKSSVHDEAGPELPTAPTSLEDSTSDTKRTLSVTELDSRKRKRSIMAGSGLDDDEEPLRKRTGSIMTPGDDFAIEDEEQLEEDEEDLDVSNPISGTISGDEGGEDQDEAIAEEVDEAIVAEEEEPAPEAPEVPLSPKRRGRKKRKTLENGVDSHEDDPELLPDADPTMQNGQDHVEHNEEEVAENEGDDEAEAAARNEEELEKKRIAAEQLTALEKQFITFRERLHKERLDALDREEAMLREDISTHPKYLAMMQAVIARRDERLKISDNLRVYEMKTLTTFAKARRSQILVQYKQQVRHLREEKLEDLGKQWYDIQHDRRSYGASVPEYTLKFPKARSQQVLNQVAYSNEVSILSGIAKYVGFPSAPPMAAATEQELADDFAKMGRSRHPQPVQVAAGSALHELAALRAGSTSRYKPAEDFIERTPWANPQHPSHAHLLQRQSSGQQAPRTTSPFAQMGNPRRHSQQQNPTGPISGTFSSTPPVPQTNGALMSGGRISPHNPFTSVMAHSHINAPSPLASRQVSLSPQQSRQPLDMPNRQATESGTMEAARINGVQQPPASNTTTLPEVRDIPPQRRGLLTGHF